MIKNNSKFAAYQSVRVTDETLERHGQVGSSVGLDEDGDELVRFDDGQDSFSPDSLTGL